MAPAHTTSAAGAGAPPPAKLGLRERKKIQTRQAIRRAAYALFEEQGYEATPVDQIAEAADVSPSTVFRYFPSKEDIVLTDEYDPVMEAAIRARPADEPPIEATRHAVLQTLRTIVEHDMTELVQRSRILRDIPAVRGRAAEGMAATSVLLRRVLAERTGRSADDLELKVVTAAVLASMQEALMHWIDHEESTNLVELLDEVFAVLTRGLTL